MELRSATRSVSPKLISSSISSSHDGDSWTFREQFRARRDSGERLGLGKSLKFHLGAKFHFPATFAERRRVSYGRGSGRVGWGEQRGCHSHPLLFMVTAPGTLPTHRYRAGSVQPDSGRARTSHGRGEGDSDQRPQSGGCLLQPEVTV